MLLSACNGSIFFFFSSLNIFADYFQDSVDAKIIIGGLSTTCSQKIHNQLVSKVFLSLSLSLKAKASQDFSVLVYSTIFFYRKYKTMVLDSSSNLKASWVEHATFQLWQGASLGSYKMRVVCQGVGFRMLDGHHWVVQTIDVMDSNVDGERL